MALTFTAEAIPSASVPYSISTTIRGYSGSWNDLRVATGVAATQPAVFSDLSSSTQFALITQSVVTATRNVGVNILNATIENGGVGSVGDNIWICLFEAPFGGNPAVIQSVGPLINGA